MKQGIYDISIEDYHGGDGVSRSGLVEYQRSPLHYHHKYVLNNREIAAPSIITKRDAMAFGNAFHKYVLERDDYLKEYLITEKVNKTTKAGKEKHLKYIEEANGRLMIDAEAQKVIEDMANAVWSHRDAPFFIRGSLYEKSLYWEEEDTGLLVKARPDIWNKNFICDLKTAADGSPAAFARSMHNFGYYLQCAMIHDGLKALQNIFQENFVFVVVEKEPPHAVAVYPLDKEDLMLGLERYKRTLKDIADSYQSNHWPSYPTTTISLPNYARKEDI